MLIGMPVDNYHGHNHDNTNTVHKIKIRLSFLKQNCKMQKIISTILKLIVIHGDNTHKQSVFGSGVKQVDVSKI